MPISSDMRRLEAKWSSGGSGWPKRLEWMEIGEVHGWTGQRISFDFPLVAVTGENGAGKSTVLQAAASIYQSPEEHFASDFFPDTAWDRIRKASIRFAGREGTRSFVQDVRKPTTRWRGNPERPERQVVYIDLSRVLPVSGRTGYSRLAKDTHREVSAQAFDRIKLARFSQIMGRSYDLARMALTDADSERHVPVLRHAGGTEYSGFHQGQGETTIAELLGREFPDTALVLIDEIETSLHPRAQRRLIRDLAALCRERDLQVILTTHSPYILDELPPRARAYIMHAPDGRNIIYGVSPEFAMTRMDDVQHSECDLYVEDRRSKTLLNEILARYRPETALRCSITDYGAASVGKALGQMKAAGKFRQPTCVFLDGDQGAAPGCIVLPGDGAPEEVVFTGLKEKDWGNFPNGISRAHASVVDECTRAMSLKDPHEWVSQAANRLLLGSDALWQRMCGEWVRLCLSEEDAGRLIQPIEDALVGIKPEGTPIRRPDVPVMPETTTAPAEPARRPPVRAGPSPSSAPELPFGQ